MSWAILTNPDGVMGHHIDDGQLHQCSQTDCGSGIVGEYEKSGRVGAYPSVEGHARATGGHGVFSHTPGNVASFVVTLGEIG